MVRHVILWKLKEELQGADKEAVKAGIRMAGGTPIEFPAIGVCDGIAMGHEGMRYSLVTRELIADSIAVRMLHDRPFSLTAPATAEKP